MFRARSGCRETRRRPSWRRMYCFRSRGIALDPMSQIVLQSQIDGVCRLMRSFRPESSARYGARCENRLPEPIVGLYGAIILGPPLAVRVVLSRNLDCPDRVLRIRLVAGGAACPWPCWAKCRRDRRQGRHTASLRQAEYGRALPIIFHCPSRQYLPPLYSFFGEL